MRSGFAKSVLNCAMDKSTDQMTFMDEERVILVDREDNIIGSATKRVRLLDFIAFFLQCSQYCRSRRFCTPFHQHECLLPRRHFGLNNPDLNRLPSPSPSPPPPPPLQPLAALFSGKPRCRQHPRRHVAPRLQRFPFQQVLNPKLQTTFLYRALFCTSLQLSRNSACSSPAAKGSCACSSARTARSRSRSCGPTPAAPIPCTPLTAGEHCASHDCASAARRALCPVAFACRPCSDPC
jgi:hypothetical protein